MHRHAIIRPPSANFAEGLTTADLGKPISALALEQHSAYRAALEQCGLTIISLPPLDHSRFDLRRGHGCPDGPFAVLARPGASSRAGEVNRIKNALEPFYQELFSIRKPGTLDGGDVCEVDSHFFIGISERTNEAGAFQLAEILSRAGYTSSCIDIRAVAGILHLKSGLAHLGKGRLVVMAGLASRSEFRGYDLIE